MMTTLVNFPLWRYLNQPIFEAASTPVINPKRFWYVYRVEFLERCLERECRATGKSQD